MPSDGRAATRQAAKNVQIHMFECIRRRFIAMAHSQSTVYGGFRVAACA